MDKRTKEFLREYYDAPAPEGRQWFLRRYAPRHISLFHMLFTQLRYISKAVWAFSLLFFAAACVLSGVEEYTRGVNWIYGMVPFLVMLSVTESCKSCRYGMQELEQGALFNLQSIVLMRMLILGAGNLLMLLVISFATGAAPLAQLMYLLVPYLLTASLGLAAVRRFRGTEGNWLCFCAAVFVAAAVPAVHSCCSVIYEEKYLLLWMFAAFAAAVFTVRESIGLLREPGFV
ncbi:MAG: hypothetical protein NC355_07990 [Blautia sp.]|nr:hypothetical protein [Blautia sp.]